MEITQSYARPSSATMSPEGMRLDVSAEQSRPGVHLEALVKDSLPYARLMLALYAVVSGDFRNSPKDHTAYQEWVQQRYLEELPDILKDHAKTAPALLARRDIVLERYKEKQKEVRQLETAIAGPDYNKAVRRYYNWLYTHNPDAWYVLDPVVSVHPDSLIFEVFSQDESSYGRVTVPMDRLEQFGTTVYGTTNIDFSRSLADEIERIRTYRPAWLQVGAEGVTLATGAGERLEKKIDLPPSWVRGFLQVQSAASFPGTDVTLSAETVAEVLSLLRRQMEKKGPRSLRFVLAPGEKPSILVEPWNVEVKEPNHVFPGTYKGDIRIWGRRRLFALESLLPHAEKVQVRLLGGGMPSYWSVFQKTLRFDLGLSGWTKNDWAQAARFDLLASTSPITEENVTTAAKALSDNLRLSPQELADQSGLTREVATTALQRLCAEGRAMYDPAITSYRWRQMLPGPVKLPETEEDKRLATARRLIARNAVRWQKPDEEPNRFGAGGGEQEKLSRCQASVKGDGTFIVTLDLDADGRVQFANCTCSWHRREKLRKGPCAHILAASALASQRIAAQSDAPAAATAGAAKTPPPDLFAGKTFVFTGALTIYTRDQAEALVRQYGGNTSGSVSRATTHLVAGDKAGSKLARAQQLGIPVLSETDFRALLEG